MGLYGYAHVFRFHPLRSTGNKVYNQSIDHLDDCSYLFYTDLIYLCFLLGGKIKLKVGLLNVDGYYNSLLSFIDKAVDEGFITAAARQIIVSAPTAQELLCKLEVRPYTSLLSFGQSALSILTVPSFLIILCLQEYVPKHSGVAPKLSWEMEQQLGYATKSEIAR